MPRDLLVVSGADVVLVFKEQIYLLLFFLITHNWIFKTAITYYLKEMVWLGSLNYLLFFIITRKTDAGKGWANDEYLILC